MADKTRLKEWRNLSILELPLTVRAMKLRKMSKRFAKEATKAKVQKRKISRKIFGGVKSSDGMWGRQTNKKVINLFKKQVQHKQQKLRKLDGWDTCIGCQMNDIFRKR